jgi:predicted acetyltransferase
MKKLIAKETFITDPKFIKIFEIHTDASKVRFDDFISQERESVAFSKRTFSKLWLHCNYYWLAEEHNVFLGLNITIIIGHAIVGHSSTWKTIRIYGVKVHDIH